VKESEILFLTLVLSFYLTAANGQTSLCGKILGDDLLIYWIGCRPDQYAHDSPQLWLHASCALNLSACLAQDVGQARTLQKT
jgi:hypothetical protein